MLAIALFALAGIFALLLGVRVGGARRAALMQRWPALLFAGAALLLGARGAVQPALLCAALAVLFWQFWPRVGRLFRRPSPAIDLADAEARRLLGVSSGATEAEIRRAYREKMRSAHPDQGGTTAEAARLTASRDLLLRGLRRR